MSRRDWLGGNLTSVVVSKVDIPANTDLNQLIDDDQFTSQDVPTDTLVEGAITNVQELRNRRNSVFILAGEQIPLSRVQGGKVEGGALSIPEGYQAVTVALGAPAAIGAALAGGDNVTVLASFTDVDLSQVKIKGVKTQPQQTQTGGTTGAGQQGTTTQSADVTVVLVPTVQVLRVNVPQSSDEQAAPSDAVVSVTLVLLPEDAQKFVFSLEQGTVYLSLLPPDADGVTLDPITVTQIVSPPKANKGK